MTNQELLEELSFLKKKIKKLEESESQQKPTEMALHESEHKYRKLAEDMPALICTFLPDSTLTYVNKAYCELFQKQPDDLVGQKFLDFLPDEETRENVRRQYISLTPENPVKTYEHKVIVSDGTNRYHWHRWTDRAFFSDNGHIIHFQSIGQDITEHKRIEAALRESESFLNTLLNSIPIPVFYKDSGGRYLGFNNAYETFFGANREQLIGKTVFDINPPDLAEIYNAKDAELFESGGVQHYESQVKSALGPVRDVIFNKATFADSQGAISGLIGAILDVTDRKQAEEALRESEIKYRTIVENIPQKIFIKDNVSRYVSVNENYARDLGIRPEEVKGKSDYDFFPKELAEKYRDDDQRIMRTNHVEHIEERYVQNGRDIWIHTVKAPVQDEQGKITGVFGIFMDITERKQAEEALVAEHHLLDETNTALRVLLQRREEDQKEMERKILDNIRKLVLPHLDNLRSLKLNEVQANRLDMISANLQQVISPFLKNISAFFADFTLREIQIANMVREGRTSKEIASLFNSSIRSIEFHRDNIRKKLGLNQKKTNLSTFLRNLSD